ncbi:hypothetical protein [Thalassoroseus pseudoceratinae]|uniref:hypothetical protein n=1 Tax=Thalassoroseus pseudoceratinae TaxID=2713176 RepID=UPI0014245486|nr:hypothetical protein [Thalassoroseus pseudoceratinae]
MPHRNDIQLAICEQIMMMDIDGLADLCNSLTGSQLCNPNPKNETVEGEVWLDDYASFKPWLSFLHYTLPERFASDGNAISHAEESKDEVNEYEN